MKFLPLLLAPLAIATPLFESLEARAESAKAGAKAVEAGVKTIVSGIKTLNTTVESLTVDDPEGLFIALKIQKETTDLENDIKKVIAAAKASPKWNNKLSAGVGTDFLALPPKIKSLLNLIVTKKPAFASAVLFVGDLSKTVEQSLVTQKSLSGELGDAVTAKLSKSYASLAPRINKEIQGYFSKAIKAYKACTGLVCLPPL